MPTRPPFPQSLEKPPDKFLHHYQWADYIELLCLVNIDGEFSQSDFLSRVQNRVDDLHEIEEEAGEENLPIEEIDDKWYRRSEDYFAHLEFRQKEFGDFYPFEPLSSTSIKLKEPLDEKHKLYLFFLFAANLRYCLEHTSDLTGSFELISRDALKQLLPENAEVHVFGKGSEANSPYQGTLWNKINKLAEDLRAEVKAKQKDYPSSNKGDGGLDIVGWIPCPDNAPGLFAMFGQCACSPDQWISKQHSSSWDTWSQSLHMCPHPTNTAFIPLCFRNIDGMWENDRSIHNSLLIDRLRFVRLLRDQLTSFSEYSSYPVINDLIMRKEALN